MDSAVLWSELVAFEISPLASMLHTNSETHSVSSELELNDSVSESELLQLLFARLLFVVWRSLAPPGMS